MRLPVAVAMTLAAGTGWAASPRLVSTVLGKDAPLGLYAVVRSDCSVGTAPEIRITRPPMHGVIMVQDLRLEARAAEPCGLVVAPAHRVTYRPAAGFIGGDEVTFMITDRDTGQSDSHPVMIVVQPAPAEI